MKKITLEHLKDINNLIKEYNKSDDENEANYIQDQIENSFDELQNFVIDDVKILKKLTKLVENYGLTLEVKVLLSAGCYTRKNVYADLSTFNYVDETEDNFKTMKQAEKYWKDYFTKHKIAFNGVT